jgi:ATP-binding cassette subfamily F protein uup
MNILSVEKLAKSFGDRFLFKDLSFGLNQGQKVALVGLNGTGKSTLMRIIAGKETADSGNFSIRSDVRTAYLEQEPLMGETASVNDAIFASEHADVQLLRRYYQLISKDDLTETEQESMHELIMEIDGRQLWDYEQQVKQILSELGITQFDQPVHKLSGGQRKRVAIAQALVSKPEFILMDEPTNHLDLELIEWLEHYLSTQRITVLMITHDRYFLESVCNEIFELNRGKMYRHAGSYADFVENKTIREEIAAVDADKARNLMRKELEWMRRQPKARGTKSKARVENFYKLEEKAKGPSVQGQIELDVAGKRLGGKVLELSYLQKKFGEHTILDDFSYIFTRTDRIGVVGKNGVGKSTFLNLIAGLQRPDGGKIDKGDNTTIGYYTQQELQFVPGQTVIDLVKARAEIIKLSDGRELSASNFLNRFLFPPKQQHDLVSKLSGGEKRRLQLLLVLMQGPNFLILDEPTNDLDLETLNVIEEFLDEFQGCLVLVSHDRYFMDRLVDHLFVFEGEGQIRDFPGNYTDYRESLKLAKSVQKQAAAEQSAVEPVVKVKVAAPVAPKVEAAAKRKPSFQEKKEFEQLELRIAELHQKIEALEKQLSAGEGNAEDYARWGRELTNSREQLDAAELRWLDLSELM